jgi:hypothetical protein
MHSSSCVTKIFPSPGVPSACLAAVMIAWQAGWTNEVQQAVPMFPVEALVHARHLSLLSHAQAEGLVDEHQQDERDHTGVGDADQAGEDSRGQ